MVQKLLTLEICTTNNSRDPNTSVPLLNWGRKLISMLWEAQGDYCIGCVGAALLENTYPLWDGDVANGNITLKEDDGQLVILRICS